MSLVEVAQAQTLRAERQFFCTQAAAAKKVDEYRLQLGLLPVEPEPSLRLYGFGVYIDYSPESNEEAEEIRGQVQQVLHKPAQRELNGTTVAYTFEYRNLYVKIEKGKLAPNCRIEAYETTETRFKIVCPETEEEVITNARG
jgi:hypothetical protein